MRQTGIELGPIVATAVAHDTSAIADGVDERIHARRRSLVGSVFLADLDRAPVALHTDISVARAQSVLDLGVRGRSGGRRKTNLRLDLEYAGQVRDKLARTANAEIREVARQLSQPAIVADRAKAVGQAVVHIVERHVGVAIQLDLAATDRKLEFGRGFLLILRGGTRRSLGRSN